MIIWFSIFICGLLTFLMRFIPISEFMPKTMPKLWVQAMRFVPISVLTAIIVPAVLIPDGQSIMLSDNLRIPTAILAVFIALWTRSVLATLIVGMGAIWLLSWYFGFHA